MITGSEKFLLITMISIAKQGFLRNYSKVIRLSLITYLLIGLNSCQLSVSTPANLNSYSQNFNALWSIMDQHYCFFSLKHINWDSIKIVYQTRLSKMDTLNDVTFFNLCANMINELKDGHVNLTSPFNMSRYWAWFQNYPANFNSTVIFGSRYLGNTYRIAGGFDYTVIPNTSIGYIYYPDFTQGFSNANLSYMIASLSRCDGLILDVRDNSGGTLTYAQTIASRFTTQTVKYGYISHKIGPGHNDFSTPEAEYVTPYATTPVIDNWVNKPVVVLTNRLCYSATNEFVSMMKELPNVTIIGDQTGGGGGLPMSSELPNGWTVRYSACPMFDAHMNSIEFGIMPTIKVNMNLTDMMNGIDSIIETAINYLQRLKKTNSAN